METILFKIPYMIYKHYENPKESQKFSTFLGVVGIVYFWMCPIYFPMFSLLEKLGYIDTQNVLVFRLIVIPISVSPSGLFIYLYYQNNKRIYEEKFKLYEEMALYYDKKFRIKTIATIVIPILISFSFIAVFIKL